MKTRMHRFAISFVLLVTIGCLHAAEGPLPGDGPWLQYVDVRHGGFDPDKLEAVRQAADEAGSGAVLVVRNGVVVTAWGDVERKFKCHSMRKSFLSALYGRAVMAGKVDLQATLASLGIDDMNGLTDAEKQATVEMLIQARSGVYHPAAKEPRSMKQNRPERGSAEPGEHFWYNNWDFNTAGFLYEQATGQGIFEAFRDELAGPLGLEDFDLDDTVYQFERDQSRVPAYAFRLSARDAARFGLLYLRDGRWAGRQLVPAEWIERSWRMHSDLGEGRGYGYMWWIHGPGTLASRPELVAYAASGSGGQLIAVVPALDLVVVHRGDTDFSRGVGDGASWGVVRGIIEAIDGDVRKSRKRKPVEPLPFSRELPPIHAPATKPLPAETLERYVGRYRVGENAQVDVRRMGDFLVGAMTGFGEADFRAVTETEFWSKATGVRVTFEVDEAGKVARAKFLLRGQEMVALPVTAE